MNKKINLQNPYISAVFSIINSFKQPKKSPVVQNNKYNPLCEYILKVDGLEKTFIASMNTRAAARNIKREYQRDKGVKVIITQFTYASDRLKGGMILDQKVIR